MKRCEAATVFELPVERLDVDAKVLQRAGEAFERPVRPDPGGPEPALQCLRRRVRARCSSTRRCRILPFGLLCS
eukprot:5995021-Pleurochrysis_carterae.AAC.1